MLENIDLGAVARNLVVYAVGVGAAVVGALGLANAIELSAVLAGAAFVGGIVVVVAVHEFFSGPIYS